MGAPASEGRETHWPPGTLEQGRAQSPPTSHPYLFALPPPLLAVTSGRNPCADRNGGCMHLCRALRGLAHCECHAGYRLAADRKTCEGRTPFPRAAPPKGHLQRDPVPLDQPGCVLLHLALRVQSWPGAPVCCGAVGVGVGVGDRDTLKGPHPSSASFEPQLAGFGPSVCS